MPMLIEAALWTVVIPGSVALIILTLAWRSGSLLQVVSGSFAAGSGFLVGYFGLRGLPGILPIDVTGWLFYAALAGIVVGSLHGSFEYNLSLRIAIRGGLLLFITWLFLQPLMEHTWSMAVGSAWLVLLAGIIFVSWQVIDKLSDTPGVFVPLSLLLLTSGSSVVLALSGSIMLAQLGGVLAATLGAFLLVSIFKKEALVMKGAIPVFLLVLFGLWISGYFYAEVPAISMFLLLVKPVVIWLAKRFEIKIQAQAWQLALKAAAFVPLALAITLAVVSGEDTGYYNSY